MGTQSTARRGPRISGEPVGDRYGVESDACEATTELEFAFEMEGVLVWDIGSRCMDSLAVLGEVAMSIRNLQSASGDGFEFEADALQEFEGELSWSATVE